MLHRGRERKPSKSLRPFVLHMSHPQPLTHNSSKKQTSPSSLQCCPQKPHCVGGLCFGKLCLMIFSLSAAGPPDHTVLPGRHGERQACLPHDLTASHSGLPAGHPQRHPPAAPFLPPGRSPRLRRKQETACPCTGLDVTPGLPFVFKCLLGVSAQKQYRLGVSSPEIYLGDEERVATQLRQTGQPCALSGLCPDRGALSGRKRKLREQKLERWNFTINTEFPL